MVLHRRGAQHGAEVGDEVLAAMVEVIGEPIQSGSSLERISALAAPEAMQPGPAVLFWMRRSRG